VTLAVLTVAVCLILGLPCARYLTLLEGRYKKVVTWCIISPLLVSSVGRILGWYAVVGPGSWLSQLLSDVGIGGGNGLLGTNAAVVIGLSGLMLPMMVLALTTAYGHVDGDLVKAAASLGASDSSTMLRVELPLVMSGILSGCLIVFALSVSSFIAPALLGNPNGPVMAYQIYLDILTYFKQPAGTALAILLVLGTLIVMLCSIVFVGRSRNEATPDA
jgi:putative spermidine/putrescine transport system permease protein